MTAVDPNLDPDADRHRRLALAMVVGLVAVVGIAVPAVVALVAGRSSANFADTEVLDANRLGAAVLDLELTVVPVDGTEEEAVGPTGGEAGDAVFSATNLAPGDSVSGQLELVNVGDLPFRAGLSVVGDGGILARWLRFEAWVGSGTCRPDQPGPRLATDVAVGTAPVVLADPATGGVAVLEPGRSMVLCLGAHLPLETPNEAQGQHLDVTLIVPVEQVVEGGS